MEANKILILDIETTGFLNKGGSIVEIGMVELDLNNGIISDVYDTLCKENIFNENHTKEPFGWIFNNSNLKYEDVLKAPSFEDIKPVVQMIINKYTGGCTAYNNVFDFNFLEDRGINFVKKLACPMKLATNICKISGKFGNYKWPSVEEAYSYFLNNNDYIEKHRGLDDARHEAEIIYSLYKTGHFKI